MKWFTRGMFLSLLAGLLMGVTGCGEDNEKASGVATGPTSKEGAGEYKPMTPEEYAKKQSSTAALPTGYPGGAKAKKAESVKKPEDVKKPEAVK